MTGEFLIWGHSDSELAKRLLSMLSDPITVVKPFGIGTSSFGGGREGRGSGAFRSGLARCADAPAGRWVSPDAPAGRAVSFARLDFGDRSSSRRAQLAHHFGYERDALRSRQTP